MKKNVGTEKSVRSFIALLMACILLQGSADQVWAAATQSSAPGGITMTSSQSDTAVLTCPRAVSSRTVSVLDKTEKISGKDSFAEGIITGKYTGTKRTRVTDTFTKGKTKKTRKTIVTRVKKYTFSLSSQAIQREVFALFEAPVKRAWDALGFIFELDLRHMGCELKYDSQNRKIVFTPGAGVDDLCFMMGYFISQMAGNAATSKEFKQIYAQEKGKYKGKNPFFARQNSSTFFAAAARDYAFCPSTLVESCPLAYEYIFDAIMKITDRQIAIWQKKYKTLVIAAQP
ncbi:MAG: hypothetical protein IKE58_11905 [Blautia sp.]|nr:hypothetical protein [Blautia sp.]